MAKTTRETEIKVSTSERNGIARALGKAYQAIFDKFNDIPKKDLSYGELQELCMAEGQNELKSVFMGLVSSNEINGKSSFKKQPNKAVLAFKGVVKIEIDPNDPTSVQEGIAQSWLEWHNRNFPNKQKETSTPKSVSVANVLDFCLAEGKSIDVAQIGAKSLKTRLSSLDLEKSKLVASLFVKAS